MPGQELVGGEAVHHARGTGEEPEQVDAGGHLVDGGLDRLPGVGALEATELVRLQFEEVGELEQEQRAILRGRVLVALERGRGRRDRAVHVLLGTGGDAADHLVVGRVDDLGRPSVGSADEVAADELLIGLHSLERLGHRGASSEVNGSCVTVPTS